MSEIVVPGRKQSESEFQGGLTGACGPNAIAAAARWSSDNPVLSTVFMNQQLQRVVNSPNGVAELGQLEQVMHNLGYATTRYSGGPLTDFIVTHGGRQAIVAFLDLAQALRDSITGASEDATNLHGHFITLFGYSPDGNSAFFRREGLGMGVVAADGDSNTQNPVLNGVRVHRGLNSDMVYYTIADLLSAGLADMFSVAPRSASAMGVPSGWTDDGTALHNPVNPFVVTNDGFRPVILSWPGGWEPENVPLQDLQQVTQLELGNPGLGGGYSQIFRLRVLAWQRTGTFGGPNGGNGGTYVMWSGQELLATQAALEKALASGDAAQIAVLQAKIAAALQALG